MKIAGVIMKVIGTVLLVIGTLVIVLDYVLGVLSDINHKIGLINLLAYTLVSLLPGFWLRDTGDKLINKYYRRRYEREKNK